MEGNERIGVGRGVRTNKNDTFSIRELDQSCWVLPCALDVSRLPFKIEP
jgi:hypothetical protein